MKDLKSMSDEELLAYREECMKEYRWLASLTYDDGDSDMFYFYNITPINKELKARGIEY